MTPANFHNLEVQEENFFTHLKKLPAEDQAEVIKAFQLSKKAHRGQKRLDGVPFVIHPIRITIYLMTNDQVKDPNILSAALLHDVVEDTSVTQDDISKNFNKEISQLVDNLSEKNRPKSEKEKWASKDKYYTSILNQDKTTQLIKSADILDNVRSWLEITNIKVAKIKFPRWLHELETFFLPIAKNVNETTYKEIKRHGEWLKKRLG